jgi:hypothetical protein
MLPPSSGLKCVGTLRLAVSQSVCLGVEPHSVAHDQIFVLSRQFCRCTCMASSLTGGWVCLLSKANVCQFYMLTIRTFSFHVYFVPYEILS